MGRLMMGNPKPHELVTDDAGERTYRLLGESSETVTPIPDGYPVAEVFLSVTLPDGIWARHSAASSPSWVASDVPLLADLLASHYGCKVRKLPKGSS